MNPQSGKQFGEDNPSALIPDILTRTLDLCERRYDTAFPVSGDNTVNREYLMDRPESPKRFTSVANGAGPFPMTMREIGIEAIRGTAQYFDFTKINGKTFNFIVKPSVVEWPYK